MNVPGFKKNRLDYLHDILDVAIATLSNSKDCIEHFQKDIKDPNFDHWQAHVIFEELENICDRVSNLPYISWVKNDEQKP